MISNMSSSMHKILFPSKRTSDQSQDCSDSSSKPLSCLNMRFLLNSALRSTGKAVRKGNKSLSASRFDVNVVSPSVSSRIELPCVTKSWGQQCSPACGCVVRFEATVDPSTQVILSATYHAKSVVSVEKDGQLHPLRTTRTNKPMMKDCKCKTVHTLANDIISYVTSKNLDSVRNMSEFSGNRSSTAFRHAVLVENQLPRTDTHCFDVLEEAYSALIKGFIPRGRRSKSCFDKILVEEYLWTSPVSDEDEHLEPAPRPNNAMDQIPLSMSSPRSVSTLTMFDINAEYHENEESQRQEQEEHMKLRSMDWLSFVDEQNRNQGMA